MARRFLVHAPNVHQGGGATLLRSLLVDLPDQPGHLILDQRLNLNSLSLSSRHTVHRVAPTFISRLSAERLLTDLATSDTHVLCFAGMPPLFACRGQVSVFVQNVNLITSTDLSGFPWKQRLRIHLERCWFKHRLHHATELLVQTATVGDLLRAMTGTRLPIRIVPFAPKGTSATPATLAAFPQLAGRSIAERLQQLDPQHTTPGHRYDFCYVATGEPNKNHRRLIEAWTHLAARGLRPSLCLTISPDLSPDLAAWLTRQTRQHGLRIDNVGYVTREEVDVLYRHSTRLIYPSLYESFGLPLLEARDHGLPIVAAERDYVRDVVSPEHAFDPESSRSIARAVERALGASQVPAPVATPREFLSEVLAA